MHDLELAIVLIATVALVLGAGLRLFSRWTGFPYTIAVLLVGLGIGLLLERSPEGGHDQGHGVLALLAVGGRSSPHLIMFVFLPALVFESAYAIDVHEFRKSFGAVVVYAVPALILSTLATAGAMVVITGGGWAWGWSAALVFGALISATDPVAVVAILRELGVSKRLSVLIEGESLMNDGTAIVVFTLLMGMLSGEIQSFDPVSAVGRFAWVVSVGALVGFVLAFIVSTWIDKLFNDPLAEITLTLVLAYSAMIIAEGFLHVSGVIAVVVAGLWMSAKGKTRISPEVQHFLHRFWGMLGYLANTLIFFIVGLVVAPELKRATLSDLVTILLAYLAIMLIRVCLTYTAQPLASRLSEGVSSKDSALIAWGGLRGAVSLALALLVSQQQKVPAEIRSQILLVTAGVVLLTILVNGTTIGRLLSYLGFDKKPLAEQLAVERARHDAVSDVRARVAELSASRALGSVGWSNVERELSSRLESVKEDGARVAGQLACAPESERVAGRFQRALAVERQSYRKAFAAGLLGARSTELLVAQLDGQLDRLGRGDLAAPVTRVPDNLLPFWRRWRRRAQLGFDEVTLLYDLSRAESAAAQVVLETLGYDEEDPETCSFLRETYRGFLKAGKERVEDLRTNLPELTQAVEARLAERITLNLERDAYESLAKRGVLASAAAETELESVDRRMQSLKRRPERVAIPETADLVADAPIFRELDADQLQELADLTEEMVLAPGETLFRQGDAGDAMYVISRGALHVLLEVGDKEELLDVIGGGDIIGEMSLLTGAQRTASARAATAMTLGRISRPDFQHLMTSQPTLSDGVWKAVARRSFDNALRGAPRFPGLDHEARLKWVDTGQLVHLEPGETLAVVEQQVFAFVVAGQVEVSDQTCAAGTMSDVSVGQELGCKKPSVAVLLGPLHGAAIGTPGD